ncbi:hypothetical protein [Leptothrix discophora]|uniref:Uncharacterized protein n=1 Tax=Leptothrix discophora TaxID=89 RepID=A0ABT9G2J4_LEPDI|nr:hypothetical protein [Leptothrix discophora]MDP4300683.1 hypothetical protein [Leptothrix discophora]
MTADDATVSSGIPASPHPGITHITDITLALRLDPMDMIERNEAHAAHRLAVLRDLAGPSRHTQGKP